jgi:hypothetical protein
VRPDVSARPTRALRAGRHPVAAGPLRTRRPLGRRPGIGGRGRRSLRRPDHQRQRRPQVPQGDRQVLRAGRKAQVKKQFFY